jgi:predicted RNase H-like nuclease (RuvC/YqgF family)
MRFLIMQRGSAVFALILFISVVACTASLPRTPGPDVSLSEPSSALRNRIFTSPEDDLFREGLSCLITAAQPADYEKARSAFAALVTSYPKSKGAEPAQRFIALLDGLQACQSKGTDDRKHIESLMREKEGALLENESLRKNLKQTHERLQTETQKLLAENEQLKKDLQLLKDLEIQLERRERMLR